MDHFLRGVIACASLVVGMFFFRFWRLTGDRLFVVFAAAFVFLGATRLAVTLEVDASEDRVIIYVARLLAYSLILAGIWDKNRNLARSGQ